ANWLPPRWAKLVAALALGVGLAGLGLVAAGVSGAGPLGGLATRAGVRQRGYYWDTAWTMLERNPLLGVGFDGFGTFYRGLRDVADATGAALFQVADAAHSVPLGMLAGGGLLTAVSYMAFALAVGVLGVWSVVTAQGASRLLNAAVLSAWAAYQVQSLVSIDVPALAVWHWLLAGAVVAGIPLRRAADRDARKGSGATRGNRTSPRRPRPAPAAITAVLILAALWAGTFPARRDVAAGSAYRAASDGDHSGLAELERVATAVPWEPEYWESLGRASVALGDQAAALAAFEEAASRDPGGLSPVLNAARAAAATGQDALAAHYYRLALSRDPHSPELSFEFGQFMASEDVQAAIDHVERAVSARPETTTWWVYLGKLLVLAGHDERAIEAAQAAHDLDPETYGTNADVVRVLIQAGAPQAALEVLEPLLARAEDANLLALAGAAYETLDEPERAEALYRRALTYDGDFPEAVQGLTRLGTAP
ncbi:MAG: tetratricopeptide repeat protein, partial [Candidatus Rokuibacteriota bacterium]